MGFANACRIASVKVVSIQATHSSTLAALFFAEKRWHGNYSFNASVLSFSLSLFRSHLLVLLGIHACFCCCFERCCIIFPLGYIYKFIHHREYTVIHDNTGLLRHSPHSISLFSAHKFNTIRSQNMNSNMWNWMCTGKQMNWNTHTEEKN